MSRERRRLVLAAIAAVVIVAGGWILRGLGDDDPATTAPQATPPTAPADGFRWVGSGHVVVSVPDDWDSDIAGCTDDLCAGGGEAELRPTVSVGFSMDDAVSPRDETVLLDGVTAVRSEATCGDDGCTGRIVVPSEHAVVFVRGASEADVDELLDGVRVLRDRVAVPETRFADEPSATDARRFREWAESLGLQVEYVPIDGEVPGEVVAVEPSTGTVVDVGTTIEVSVGAPIPEEPDCSDLALEADGWRVYPFESTVRVTLDADEDLSWEATGACADLVILDDSNPGVPSWVVPFCSGLDDAAATTCAAGMARIGAVVVTRAD